MQEEFLNKEKRTRMVHLVLQLEPLPEFPQTLILHT